MDVYSYFSIMKLWITEISIFAINPRMLAYESSAFLPTIDNIYTGAGQSTLLKYRSKYIILFILLHSFHSRYKTLTHDVKIP